MSRDLNAALEYSQMNRRMNDYYDGYEDYRDSYKDHNDIIGRCIGSASEYIPGK